MMMIGMQTIVIDNLNELILPPREESSVCKGLVSGEGLVSKATKSVPLECN